MRLATNDTPAKHINSFDRDRALTDCGIKRVIALSLTVTKDDKEMHKVKVSLLDKQA